MRLLALIFREDTLSLCCIAVTLSPHACHTHDCDSCSFGVRFVEWMPHVMAWSEDTQPSFHFSVYKSLIPLLKPLPPDIQAEEENTDTEREKPGQQTFAVLQLFSQKDCCRKKNACASLYKVPHVSFILIPPASEGNEKRYKELQNNVDLLSNDIEYNILTLKEKKVLGFFLILYGSSFLTLD